jgi:antitoxin MazE
MAKIIWADPAIQDLDAIADYMAVDKPEAAHRLVQRVFVAMKVTIRKMGNSRGLIIPKPLLVELALGDEAEMSVKDGALVVSKRGQPRQGWAQASQQIAAAGDDRLVWPEFANRDDEALEW